MLITTTTSPPAVALIDAVVRSRNDVSGVQRVDQGFEVDVAQLDRLSATEASVVRLAVELGETQRRGGFGPLARRVQDAVNDVVAQS